MPTIVFNHNLKVTKDAIDTNLHVNNVEYIKWMQDAAIAHSDNLGFTMDYYLKSNHSWVARSHFIEYLKPAFLDDEIVIQTWITEIKKITSNRAYAFFRKKDKTLLAEAKTLWVYVNLETLRPSTIPDELLVKYIQNKDYKPNLS